MNLSDMSQDAGFEGPAMPVMAIGGRAAGHIFNCPLGATRLKLARPIGFKPIPGPYAKPEVDYEDDDEYTVHKFEPDEGTEGLTFALAVVDGMTFEDALVMLFSSYCDNITMQNAANDKLSIN